MLHFQAEWRRAPAAERQLKTADDQQSKVLPKDACDGELVLDLVWVHSGTVEVFADLLTA